MQSTIIATDFDYTVFIIKKDLKIESIIFNCVEWTMDNVCSSISKKLWKKSQRIRLSYWVLSEKSWPVLYCQLIYCVSRK